MDYPYLVPVILTDAIYIGFGGTTGTSTAAQRAAAYTIAEALATLEMGTFFKPTIVTGSFSWPYDGRPIILPYHHVSRILSAVPKSLSCQDDCNLVDGDGCALSWDQGQWGYVSVMNTSWLNSCGCVPSTPVEVQLVYEAGLSSGSSYHPSILLALTKVAKMILNEIIDPGANEGGEGDPGVMMFSSAGHSETRKTLMNTAMGNSAVMNFAARLFHPFYPNRALRL